MTGGVEHERHWSVEEANEALVWVAGRIARLRALVERLTAPGVEDVLTELVAQPGGGYPGREIAAAQVELMLGLQELEEAEIVVRDLDKGIIDFPALRDGDEVYLCWVHGEHGVTHWHDPAAGFLGRRPL